MVAQWPELLRIPASDNVIEAEILESGELENVEDK